MRILIILILLAIGLNYGCNSSAGIPKGNYTDHLICLDTVRRAEIHLVRLNRVHSEMKREVTIRYGGVLDTATTVVRYFFGQQGVLTAISTNLNELKVDTTVYDEWDRIISEHSSKEYLEVQYDDRENRASSSSTIVRDSDLFNHKHFTNHYLSLYQFNSSGHLLHFTESIDAHRSLQVEQKYQSDLLMEVHEQSYKLAGTERNCCDSGIELDFLRRIYYKDNKIYDTLFRLSGAKYILVGLSNFDPQSRISIGYDLGVRTPVARSYDNIGRRLVTHSATTVDSVWLNDKHLEEGEIMYEPHGRTLIQSHTHYEYQSDKR